MEFKFFQELEKEILLINWDLVVGQQYPDEHYGRTPRTYFNVTWDQFCVDVLCFFPYTLSKLVYRGETFTGGWPTITKGDVIDEIEIQIIYDKF
jgi:hypothetical protein